MLVASQWYTSNGFLAGAGIAATVLVGGAGVWITYLVSIPRRQLLYSLQSCTSLLNASADARKNIKIFHLGKELKDPHIVKISLSSKGRSDIPSSAFDQGRPIVLEVGVPIVGQLPTDVGAGPAPTVDLQNTALSIGPDLISKRQQIEFNLLTDGATSHLACESHLIDVKVREQSLAEYSKTFVRSTSVFYIGAVIFAAIIVTGISRFVGAIIALILMTVNVVALAIAYVDQFSKRFRRLEYEGPLCSSGSR